MVHYSFDYNAGNRSTFAMDPVAGEGMGTAARARRLRLEDLESSKKETETENPLAVACEELPEMALQTESAAYR